MLTRMNDLVIMDVRPGSAGWTLEQECESGCRRVGEGVDKMVSQTKKTGADGLGESFGISHTLLGVPSPNCS